MSELIKSEAEKEYSKISMLRKVHTWKEGFTTGFNRCLELSKQNNSEIFNRTMEAWNNKHAKTIMENDDEFLGHTALHFFHNLLGILSTSSLTGNLLVSVRKL